MGVVILLLNVVDIEEFECNGKNWVCFYFVDEKNFKIEVNWIEVFVLCYVCIC